MPTTGHSVSNPIPSLGPPPSRSSQAPTPPPVGLSGVFSTPSRLSVNSTRSLSPSNVLQDPQPSKAPSVVSRASSRPASVRPVVASASALISSVDGRMVRHNLYLDVVQSWSRLSTSSRGLLIYYIGATFIEIVTTVTVVLVERSEARECVYMVVFLALYLARSIVICGLLLRRFLYVQPDDLPRDLSGACGVHYKTMINWASFVLLLFSVVILTTQSSCINTAPGLFYLVLVFSLVGYACLAVLVFLWFIVMFCLNGLVYLLEIFGVGPTVMQWQGASPEMIDAIPVIKFSKKPLPGEPLAQTTPCGNDGDDEKGTAGALSLSASNMAPAPVIVVSQDGESSGSGPADLSEPSDVVIDITALGIDDSSTRADDNGATQYGQGSGTLILEELDPEVPQLNQQEKKSGDAGEQVECRISTACSICLCEYEDQEDLRRLPCDHYFHKECVDEWLKLKRTCPLCKRDITESSSVRTKKIWRRRRNNRTRPGGHGSSSSHLHH
ncbi:hypothetical protein EMPS_09694 [Entomortierella parvispora]|uniref:RING-type E3 ubiquitin transferase n=1 Tax=Entomortierella parvispora TaxID=205924 RepID=A0A9P3M0U5_9FUNG|nr:hypothetical protein EMPS_09694 [Entomortierella parvispora]